MIFCRLQLIGGRLWNVPFTTSQRFTVIRKFGCHFLSVQNFSSAQSVKIQISSKRKCIPSSTNEEIALTLRPEATASCVRACIQHRLINRSKARLWYMGPMFRYEKPQKGRYRQFHQFGIEAFGWTTPDIDAEIILVAHALWQQLNIVDHAQLEINSIGTPEARQRFRAELVEYFEKYL